MPFRRLPSFVRGVDLLYHEATFDGSLSKLAKQVMHSTTIDAATTALRAGAGTLMIGHFSARYKEISGLVEEARTVFPNTIPAIDGTTYDIGELAKKP
jgi:ribonuclease Z